MIDLATARFRRGQTENRAQPFAAGEQAISHRLVNGGRPGVFLWQKPVKRAVDRFLPGSDIRFEVHAGPDCSGALRTSHYFSKFSMARGLNWQSHVREHKGRAHGSSDPAV